MGQRRQRGGAGTTFTALLCPGSSRVVSYALIWLKERFRRKERKDGKGRLGGMKPRGAWAPSWGCGILSISPITFLVKKYAFSYYQWSMK